MTRAIFVDEWASSKTHWPGRPVPPRTFSQTETSQLCASDAELAGLLAWVMSLQWSLWSVPEPFRRLCLCRQNFVSRQLRFWFEETRFDCVIIEQEVRAFYVVEGRNFFARLFCTSRFRSL